MGWNKYLKDKQTQNCIRTGIAIFKILIWGGIKSSIYGRRSRFYNKRFTFNMISDHISDDIRPQMKILNTVRPEFFLFVGQGIFFQIKGRGDRKKKLQKWPVDRSFSELYFFFFFNISKADSKTGKVKPAVCIFKYFIIFLKIWTGQSLFTVSLSKIHNRTSVILYAPKGTLGGI